MDSIQYITETHFNQEQLPKSLNVSTISLTFQMKTIVDIAKINKYLILSEKDICTIEYNGNYRSLFEEKKKKKKSYNFHNSITLKIAVRPGKLINFKIFTNGAVQIAGCKTIIEGNLAINLLLSRLNEKNGVFNEDTKQIEEVSYIKEPITVESVKINLININFDMKFSINREALYKLLLTQHVECYYERCKHAAVSIKFKTPDKKKPISIFVFESGSIVITGSTNENHILQSYEYIKDMISRNKDEIIKTSVDDIMLSVMKSRFAHLIVKA